MQTLEERDRKVNLHKDNLNREQRYLRRRLELLSNQVDTIYKRRSVSECSTSTVSSTHSSHSESGMRIYLTFWVMIVYILKIIDEIKERPCIYENLYIVIFRLRRLLGWCKNRRFFPPSALGGRVTCRWRSRSLQTSF